MNETNKPASPPIAEQAGVDGTGDLSVLGRLLGALDAPDPGFEILVP